MLYANAETTKCPGVSHEIGVSQLRRNDPTGIVALLVHSDRAVLRIIDDHDNDSRAVLNRRCEFLTVHQETTVTRKGDHRSFRKLDLRKDSGWNAITH